MENTSDLCGVFDKTKKKLKKIYCLLSLQTCNIHSIIATVSISIQK